MRPIIVMLLISFSATVNCQIIDLDTLSGFKAFNLGDSKYKWENEIECQTSVDIRNLVGNPLDYSDGWDEYGVCHYKYKGKCCTEVLDYKVLSRELHFDSNDRISVIKIQFIIPSIFAYNQNSKKDIIENIYINFENYFGGFDYKSVNEQGDVQYFWLGKKIGIKLFLINSLISKKDYGYPYGIIIIKDSKKVETDLLKLKEQDKFIELNKSRKF